MPDPKSSARARARAKFAVASVTRSEKLVAGAAESSSLLTLQQPDVSSLDDFGDLEEESITASQQTVPHNTINGSSSTFPSCREKILINVAESVSMLTIQEQDKSSLEDSITACPQMVPHKTINGSPRTSPSQESAPAPTLQGPEFPSLDVFLDSSSEGSITDSPRTVAQNITNGFSSPALSPGSNILIRYPEKSYWVFYIRLDQRGYFWVYPGSGGPYKSMVDVDFNISLYDEVYRAERSVTPKGVPGSSSAKDSYHDRHLIQALLDQYNDEHNLAASGALKVEHLLRKQVFTEKHRWYYHFNFTVNQKVAGKNLFFAEVSHMQGRKVLEVSCCCAINTDDVDEGFICYGCTNNGNPYMQHPNVTDAYSGGRMNVYLPFGGPALTSSDEEEEEVVVCGRGGRRYFCRTYGTVNTDDVVPFGSVSSDEE